MQRKGGLTHMVLTWSLYHNIWHYKWGRSPSFPVVNLSQSTKLWVLMDLLSVTWEDWETNLCHLHFAMCSPKSCSPRFLSRISQYLGCSQSLFCISCTFVFIFNYSFPYIPFCPRIEIYIFYNISILGANDQICCQTKMTSKLIPSEGLFMGRRYCQI